MLPEAEALPSDTRVILLPGKAGFRELEEVIFSRLHDFHLAVPAGGYIRAPRTRWSPA